ncbi:glycosyltransferase family 2 protein [Planotetraspora sp. A-T 1434]|uniref:glycosyltransferase family 2 protein n=1 Tax=Planotetraspora sp. A-T 1434 TaxID=2979219 RepID=UPI0021C028BF|nr:glycosyltransferase family A protein [Planotetraspora sp. A-T 1434]MCT9932707.1 glycosyltransferase family 2 protein [Planotetraspora sp. A-T 1434]
MDQWPPVTVVVCTTGNRPDMLRAALKSVADQDYPGDITAVVVFDRCEPDVGVLSDDPHRRVTWTGNTRVPNVAGSRNSGILAAETELVGFCDDDNTWRPGKLRAQVALFSAEPEAALASCGMVSTQERVFPGDHITFDDLLRSRLPSATTSSFLMRRSLLLGPVGIFSEEIPRGFAEDYELLLRAARHAPIPYVREVLVEVPPHEGSHFYGRWEQIADSHEWLLEHYPEFRRTRRGYARLAGQVAFESSMAGNRARSLRWARRAFLTSPLEPRTYAALAICSRLVTGEWVLRQVQARGSGT